MIIQLITLHEGTETVFEATKPNEEVTFSAAPGDRLQLKLQKKPEEEITRVLVRYGVQQRYNGGYQEDFLIDLGKAEQFSPDQEITVVVNTTDARQIRATYRLDPSAGLQQKIKELENRLTQAQSERDTMEGELARLREAAGLQGTAGDLQDEINRLQGTVADLQGRITGLQESVRENQEEADELESQNNMLTISLLPAARAQLAETQQELDKQEALRAQADEELEKVKSELDGLNRNLEELAARRDDRQSRLNKLNAELEDLENRSADVQGSIEELAERRRELGLQDEELQKCKEGIARAGEELEDCRQTLETMKNEKSACEQSKNDLTAEIRTLVQDMEALRAKKEGLRTESDALGREIEEMQGIRDQQNQVLERWHDKAALQEELAALSSEIETMEGLKAQRGQEWEQLARSFSDLLSNVIQENLEMKEIVAYLEMAMESDLVNQKSEEAKRMQEKLDECGETLEEVGSWIDEIKTRNAR